ncbi:MAG: YfhO family protein [Candidatus Lindowbacteria bacterium]|nr:YfhO family protein [Candidatus Lindowbacteria bacterium]
MNRDFISATDRRGLAIIVLVLAVALCFEFWNVVFDGYTLTTSALMYGTTPQGPYGYPGNLATNGYPVQDCGASAWVEVPLTQLARQVALSGHLPLWNPHNAAGMPLAADMVTAPFFPLKLLFLLDTSAAMWDFYLLARLLLAGIFTALFLRSIGASRLAATGSALFMMFCGQTIYYINTASINSELCLPGILWAIEKMAQTRSRVYALFLALFIASVNVGGLPETSFFVLLFGAAYAAFRLVVLARENAPASRRVLGLGLLASAIGFCLAAPALVPFAEFLGVAHHAHSENLSRFAFAPAQIITFFTPFFHGKLGSSWLAGGFPLPPPYIGLVVVTLAAVGFSARGKNWGYVLFFAVSAAFFLARAFDVPGTRWMGNIPLYNKTYFPRYGGAIFNLSLAVLAGMGLDSLVERKRFPILLFLALPLSVAAIIAGYYRGVSQMLSSPMVGSMISPRWFDTNLGQYIAFHVFAAFLFLALAVAVVLLARFSRVRPQLCAILLLALYMLEARTYLAQLERTRRYEPFTKPPVIDFLRSDREPFRIVSTERILFPDTSAAFGIDDIRVLQALHHRRYVEFVRRFLMPEMQNDFVEIDSARLADPVINICNIKYLLSARETDQALPPHFRRVYDAEMIVYENTEVLARAYIPGEIQFVSSGEDALKFLETNRDRAGRGMVAVAEDAEQSGRSNSSDLRNSVVRVVSYRPDRVEIDAKLDADGFVVLLDTNYPGWKATVDGSETKIMPANYLFRAVSVPKGSHEVIFSYRPRSLSFGLALFGAGVVLGLLLITNPFSRAKGLA